MFSFMCCSKSGGQKKRPRGDHNPHARGLASLDLLTDRRRSRAGRAKGAETPLLA
jgi:hypothetical protein